MICIYFIGGSHFTKYIKYNHKWIYQLKKRNYLIKNAHISDLEQLSEDCRMFIDACNSKYKNNTIGVMGISSGGYFALRLKKIIPTLQFCIGVAPIVNPVKRSYLVTNTHIINATPNVRKIYNNIDKDTLIIISKKDLQAPFIMYKYYNFPNLIVYNELNHTCITSGEHMDIYKHIDLHLK